MRLTKILIASALVAATASPVFAQGGGGGRAPQTPEEQAAAFKAADKNGDGKIDMAEFSAMTTARMAARGGAAPDEATLKTMFDARDTNKDGGIDATENAAPGGRGGRGGGGGGRGGQ